MVNLKESWKTLSSKYTDKTAVCDTYWEEIEKKHSKKKRFYHDLTHLNYMMNLAIQHEKHLEDIEVLMFSIYYHDIIYNINRQDNEQKSADVARDRLTQLGVPTDKIVRCERQILATKMHQHHKDQDTNYLVDFDLAILGDSPEKYKEYTQKIRKEYSIFPDFLYKRGRKKVIKHFLDMEKIFKTELFYEHLEHAARKNLKVELEML